MKQKTRADLIFQGYKKQNVEQAKVWLRDKEAYCAFILCSTNFQGDTTCSRVQTRWSPLNAGLCNLCRDIADIGVLEEAEEKTVKILVGKYAGETFVVRRDPNIHAKRLQLAMELVYQACVPDAPRRIMLTAICNQDLVMVERLAQHQGWAEVVTPATIPDLVASYFLGAAKLYRLGLIFPDVIQPSVHVFNSVPELSVGFARLPGAKVVQEPDIDVFTSTLVTYNQFLLAERFSIYTHILWLLTALRHASSPEIATAIRENETWHRVFGEQHLDVASVPQWTHYHISRLLENVTLQNPF